MRNLYKQQFPSRTPEEHILDVLRLSQDEFGQFQGVAKHWLGLEGMDGISRYPPTKLRPQSLHTVASTDQNTLAVLAHQEEAAHADHKNNFHRGGGLSETFKSIFSGLWRLTPVGFATNWVMDKLDVSPNATPLSEEDHLWADIVHEAYQKQREREVKGARYVPSVSTEKIAVYIDNAAKRVHLGVRGTKMNMSDLVSDLHIVAGNKSGHEDEIRQQLTDIIGNFDQSVDFDIAGHSLGGLEVMNIMMGPSNDQLDRIKEVALFNPGLTPTHNLSTAKEAVDDPRFNFYLNTGDLISNGFASLVDSETDVHWGKAGANPLSNHSLDQWVDEA